MIKQEVPESKRFQRELKGTGTFKNSSKFQVELYLPPKEKFQYYLPVWWQNAERNRRLDSLVKTKKILAKYFSSKEIISTELMLYS